MVSKYRLVVLTVVVCLCASTVFAVPAEVVRDANMIAKLRAAKPGDTIVVKGLALGGESLADVELRPAQVWAPDAKIVVHDAAGNTRTIAPPDVKYFKGRVVGDADSAVFFSMSKEALDGVIFVGEKRFSVNTAMRLDRDRTVRSRTIDAPVLVRESTAADQLVDEQSTWTCEVDKNPALSKNLVIPGADEIKANRIRTDAGTPVNPTYALRLAIETDTELYAAFGSDGALTTYLGNLVGAASTIYERDLNTTLTIGHTNLYNAGTDPWAATATANALAELGAYWHNTNTASYAQVQRSAVVMVSGKQTFGGIAWINLLCANDFFCGASGNSCGGTPFENSYAGAYAYCGSINVIPTTVPDPDVAVNGVEYGIPADANFWMLLEFAHELGHVVNGPHTHCVSLTAGEKTTYGIGTTSMPDRNFIDTCAAQGGSCYDGSAGNPHPTEFGTIMSYCHNVIASSGFRASRYIFGKAGEASEKMLPTLTAGLAAATPNGTMTINAAPLACAQQSASVPACGGCTYQWSVTGATVNGVLTNSSVSFTPNTANVTVSVMVTNAKGCGVSSTVTRATNNCGQQVQVGTPTGLVATATGATSVSLTWGPASNALSYQIHRSTNGVTFTEVGTSATQNFTDNTAVADTAYLYKVRGVNGATTGAFSNNDLATTVVFTDASITANSTAVKVVHIMQLRTAVDAVRMLASLAAPSYTDASVTTATPCKRLHIIELRTNLDTARSLLGLSAASYTDAAITAGTTPVKRLHIIDLRTAVQ